MQAGFRILAAAFSALLCLGGGLFFAHLAEADHVRFFERDAGGVYVCDSAGLPGQSICLHRYDIPLAAAIVLTGVAGVLGALRRSHRLLLAAVTGLGGITSFFALYLSPVWEPGPHVVVRMIPLVFFGAGATALLLASPARGTPAPDAQA